MKLLLLLLFLPLLSCCDQGGTKVATTSGHSFTVYPVTIDGNDYYYIRSLDGKHVSLCPKLPPKAEKQ